MSRPHARLLLASASPRRRELLQLLGLPFEVTQADVDETPTEGEAPLALVARLSAAKAQDAARISSLSASCRPAAAAILACDTIVVFEGAIMGKPRDAAEAAAMLRRLRAREHDVCTAISLLNPGTGLHRTDVALTSLTMRPFTDEEVSAYVASGDPLDKAGAYAIQHAGFRPVAEFRGCYANVVGLPLCHLAKCLRAWGIRPQPGLPARCQAQTGRQCTVFPDILGGE